MTEVELPDGTILEFPDGTDENFMKQKTQEFWEQSQGPQSAVTFGEDMKPTVNISGYSENDLAQDDRLYEPISTYMQDRFGTHIGDYDRDRVVSMFVNNMRGFAGGNSVRAVGEISHLNSLEDKDKFKNTQAAYAIYDNMENLFGGDTTLGEKAGGVWDFVRSGVLDPVNLVSLGVGKLATAGGSRLATSTAQRIATKTMKKKLASGVGTEAAKKAGGRAFAIAEAQRRAREAAARSARDQVREAATASVRSRIMNSTAAREIAATASFDATAAAATDYLWQEAMTRTGIQEDYSVFQTGMVAATSLVLGGAIMTGAQFLKRGATTDLPLYKDTPDGVDMSDLSESLRRYIDNLPESPAPRTTNNNMADEEVSEATSDFFIKFLLGDDNLEMKGLSHVMAEQGYVWRKRNEDDRIFKFFADAIEQSDPNSFARMVDVYETGVGKGLPSIKDKTPKEFAKIFRKEMSVRGEVLGALGRASRILGRDPRSITVEEYAEYMLTGSRPSQRSRVADSSASIADSIRDKFGVPEGALGAAQNRLIRMLVANVSTSWLNITGYGFASSMNSVSDLALASLFVPARTMKKLARSGRSADVARRAAARGIDPDRATRMILGESEGVFREITDSYRNTLYKLQNTLDPNLTLDEFKKYGEFRPASVKELMVVLPGGVEDISKISSAFNPNATMVGLKADQAVDFVQWINLVPAQDAYTKSIEFMTQLDKGLRKAYGKSYSEFMTDPDLFKQMATKKFSEVEAAAVDNTLSAVFSKSYKGPGFVGEVAGVIEDARNIPGIGMLMPFGRFFNNTVAFMANNSGIALIPRAVSGERGSQYTMKELATRAAVTWTAVGALASREETYIEEGLGLFQEMKEETGAVIDETYEFPYGAYKAAARVMAYHNRGEEVPPDVREQILRTFLSQNFRGIGDAGDSVLDLLDSLLSGDGAEITEVFNTVVGGVGTATVNAATRFLDPVNTAAGLARGEDYVNVDRNQGNTWARQTFRYIDQFLDPLVNYEERQSATQGRVRSTPGRYVGTVREVELTNLERAYNLAGTMPFMASPNIEEGRTKNRFNELYYQLNEKAAGALISSDMFKRANQDQRRKLLTELFQDNKKKVMYLLERSYGTKDITTGMVLSIVNSNFSQKDIKDAMEDLNLESPIEDLEYEQLDLLRTRLKYADDLLLDTLLYE